MSKLLERAGYKQLRADLEDDEESEDEGSGEDSESDGESEGTKKVKSHHAEPLIPNNEDSEDITIITKPGPEGKRLVSYKKFVVEYYDHSQCGDCQCVHTMALEASICLGENIQYSVQATARLQVVLQQHKMLDDIAARYE